MTMGKWARWLLLAAPLVAGCGDFWQAPSGSSTTTTTTTLSSGVFYVLNQKTNQIVAFDISSGTLTTIDSYTSPIEPLAIAVAPNNQFLYVSTSSGIYLYTIGSNGALTLGNSGNAISADQAGTMQVDATNSWLVEAVSGVAELNAISINSSTGLLASSTQQAIVLPTGATVTQLAISPGDSTSCTDCYVFAAMGTSGTEAVHFTPTSAGTDPFGSIGNIPVENTGGGANAVAIDPSNLLLYVGESDALPSETQSGGVRVFTIAANAIAEISGSPYSSGGTGPSSILPASDGNYVYVANDAVSGSSIGNIASFSVSSTNSSYSLSSISTASTGYVPLSLAADSSGNFLLVANSGGSPDLEAYTMSSGTLTSVLTASTGTDPVKAIAIAVAP